MSTLTPAPAVRAPIGTIVLAVLPYAMMLGGFSGLHDVDGISRGLAAVYAVVALAILWIMLAAVLIGVRKAMPGWARIAAFVLHPAWAAAAIAVLDLQPTRSLCGAADGYLMRRAVNDRPKGSDPTFWVINDDLEILLPGIEWLLAQHCDLGKSLAELEATTRAYPESSYADNPNLTAWRLGYLDKLARLRQAAEPMR